MDMSKGFSRVVAPQEEGVASSKYFDSLSSEHHETPDKQGAYVLDQEIGRGSYGIVYSGTKMGSDEKVAVKKMIPVTSSTPGCAEVMRKAKQEVEVMKALQNCASAIRFHEYFFDKMEDQACYIVMELCSGGDLDSLIKVSRVWGH